MNNIIDLAYEVADEIKQSSPYQKMIALDKVIKEKYKNELEVYHKTFNQFDEACKIGLKYYPDAKKVTRAYQEAKTVLYEKDEVKQYFKYENQINDQLEKLSEDLLDAVSNYIKVKGAFCSWK